MGTVAIVLIVIGIICVIISIILGITDNKEQADTASYVSDYDSAKQVSQVSKSISSKSLINTLPSSDVLFFLSLCPD